MAEDPPPVTTASTSDVGQTKMLQEAGEAGVAVGRLLDHNAVALERLGHLLRATPPALTVTCARGSSDHAATYGKYLIETCLGVPTVSAAFSTVSLFDAPLGQTRPGALCIAISQSGRSPDLLVTVERYRESGALVVALVNDETSPLARLADVALPLCAGPETSVAATKSYIASLVGLAALVGAWSGDAGLQAGCRALVDGLPRAFAEDWSAAVPDLARAPSLFTIGRGYTFAIAQEAALKLKETCGLHGEAFSSAEVRHGPMAIVRNGFPVLAFAGADAAGDDVRQVCAEFAARGARVWLADSADTVPPGVNHLPLPAAAPEFTPMLAIAAFYRMVDQLAAARGFDPDAPPFLAKVTRTL